MSTVAPRAPGGAAPAPGRFDDAPFIRACRSQPVPHVPVWFMRQAGRSLPEYRKVREGIPMLQACNTPELIAEITLQPVRRYGVDGAIFFSDIVVPLKAIGVDLDIVPGVGPVVDEPFREWSDVARLRQLTAADVAGPLEAVRLLAAELGSTALIGFAGAPFTLASYLVEGGPSRDHARTKALMHGNPNLWNALLGALADIAGEFLRLQVLNGASAVQLFDSWVGALPRTDYERYVLPHSQRALSYVGEVVPRIHFGVNTGELLASMSRAGTDVVGVDFRVPLNEAAERVGPDKALQGNLDPAILFAPDTVVDDAVDSVLAAAQDLPGHIFNLGHGVLPTTNPDVLARVVERVHQRTKA